MHKLGRVCNTYGRHVLVENDTGEKIFCHLRGKKITAVVGDWVHWSASAQEGCIETIEPRKNVFFRQDAYKTKVFAANIDRVLILLAAEPHFSPLQLSRALIAASHAKVPVVLGLNKQDLSAAHADSVQRLEPFQSLQLSFLSFSAEQSSPAELTPLYSVLEQGITLVMGPSGVGKSTLINRLIPNTHAATASLSQALQTGKHTTTATSLYWLNQQRQGALIDSPGFQEFGIEFISPQSLIDCMPDLVEFTHGCKFHNCSHTHEPQCSLQEALEQKAIHPLRYEMYCRLYAELSNSHTGRL